MKGAAISNHRVRFIDRFPGLRHMIDSVLARLSFSASLAYARGPTPELVLLQFGPVVTHVGAPICHVQFQGTMCPSVQWLCCDQDCILNCEADDLVRNHVHVPGISCPLGYRYLYGRPSFTRSFVDDFAQLSFLSFPIAPAQDCDLVIPNQAIQ